MENQNLKPVVSPPRLIPSLISGFNHLSSHIHIILIPIILDLFLWFGPRLRAYDLLKPFVGSFQETFKSLNNPELGVVIEQMQQMWQVAIERFNLFSILSTFPIGVPSLLAPQGFMETPLGFATAIELPSFLSVLIFWAALSLLGLLFGCLYFYEVARATNDAKITFSWKVLLWQSGQILLFIISLFLVFILVSIPVSLVLSFIMLFSPAVSQILIFIISLLAIWLMIPFIFSPHGVFAFQKNILSSMLTSVRLVRFYLPGTSMFVIATLLLNQALNMLWTLAPETSWMMMVGIIGHAVAATGLISASFIYYRGGLRWMEENIRRFSTSQDKPQA